MSRIRLQRPTYPLRLRSSLSPHWSSPTPLPQVSSTVIRWNLLNFNTPTIDGIAQSIKNTAGVHFFPERENRDSCKQIASWWKGTLSISTYLLRTQSTLNYNDRRYWMKSVYVMICRGKDSFQPLKRGFVWSYVRSLYGVHAHVAASKAYLDHTLNFKVIKGRSVATLGTEITEIMSIERNTDRLKPIGEITFYKRTVMCALYAMFCGSTNTEVYRYLFYVVRGISLKAVESTLLEIL